MNSEIKSSGNCLYCKKIFSKVGINKHLHVHLTEKIKTNKPGQSFLLKVETDPRWGSMPYFLSLWVDGETTLDKVDDFLRDIWLECCGHMSAFRHPKSKNKNRGMFDFFEVEKLLSQGRKKEYEKIMEESGGEIPTSRKAKNVFKKEMKLNYEYDFGSTTALVLTIVDEYQTKADKPIVLLSRNNPPEIMCELCKTEPATCICSVCVYEGENLFCNQCAKKHAKTCSDFGDYAKMPLVNSPRTGICGYDGGRIDKERDGTFKKLPIKNK